MVPSLRSLDGSFELVRKELELVRKKNEALEASYTARKITQATYEYIKSDLSKTLSDLETKIKILERDRETLAQSASGDNLDSGKSQDMLAPSASASTGFSEDSKGAFIEEPSREQPADVEGKTEIPEESSCVSEIGHVETETKSTEPSEASISQEPEKGFYFYEDIQKPIGEAALSIEEFAQKVRTLPIVSLEFHQGRGDFANWIREVFKDVSLAENIEMLNDRGEALRRSLIEAVEGPKKTLSVPCPECGMETSPKKVWKMAGRANKSGKSLQLTLGHYECSGCGKSFRRVLGKDFV